MLEQFHPDLFTFFCMSRKKIFYICSFIDKPKRNKTDWKNDIEFSMLQKFKVQIEQRWWRFWIAQEFKSLNELAVVKSYQSLFWNFTILIHFHYSKQISHINSWTAEAAQLVVNLRKETLTKTNKKLISFTNLKLSSRFSWLFLTRMFLGWKSPWFKTL